MTSPTGSSFVVGVGDRGVGTTEDLFHVEDGEPDLEKLRAMMGANTAG